MKEKRCPGCMNELKQNPTCEHCSWEDGANNASHQLPVGAVLNNQYVIGRALGQGGFGITYLGWDRHLEIPVAIKEYYPNGAVMRESSVSTIVNSYGGEIGIRFQRNRERFLREAKALAKFSEEPEIVHIYSFFQENNTAYIVMEYVDGITLKQHVQNKGGKLSAEETLSLLKPVMEALEKVHRAGIVHRDISPDNIMLLPDGSIKLLDFGAVRTVEHAEQDAPLTKSTEAILKQGYAPIEQYQNRGSLGPWTDVYALCATVCYCISGHVPPDAPERMLTELPLDFIRKLPGLTEHQKNVLEKGMELRPENRIASMKELESGLLENKPVSDSNTPHVSHPAMPTKAKRKRIIPVFIVLLLAMMIGIMIRHNIVAEPETEETLNVVEEASAEETLPVTTTPAVEEVHPNTLMEQVINVNVNYNNLSQVLESIGNRYVFNSPYSRDEIISVSFLDSLNDVPEDAWDVSYLGNGAVMAWTTQYGSYRHLYIGAEGGVYAPRNCTMLFGGYHNLEKINWNNAFHTDQAENMKGMFLNCQSLIELDLNCFDTSNVTDMSSMFRFCHKINTLDVSSFDTSNVEDMSNMFNLGIDGHAENNSDWVEITKSSLSKLNIENFDTSKVRNMENMFALCTNLTALTAEAIDTQSATNLSYMFYRCYNLREIDISKFDTAQVKNMSWMFYGCNNLSSLNIGKPDTSNVTDMGWMFSECGNLTQLDLEVFDTGNVSSMAFMFQGCEKLYALNISGFDTSNVTDMSGMFSGCVRLSYLNLNHFNTEKVTDMSLMFQSCRNLRRIEMDQFNTSNVVNMQRMYVYCPAVPDLQSYDLSKVTQYTEFMEAGREIHGKPWREYFTPVYYPGRL